MWSISEYNRQFGMFNTVNGNDRVTKLAVISGHASQAFHADFFPRLVKYDVMSQPMNARKNNNPAAI